jgi:hypothetical protein
VRTPNLIDSSDIRRPVSMGKKTNYAITFAVAAWLYSSPFGAIVEARKSPSKIVACSRVFTEFGAGKFGKHS